MLVALEHSIVKRDLYGMLQVFAEGVDLSAQLLFSVSS